MGKLRQDSFFEYLLKGYILFQDLELLDIFLNAYAAVTGSGLIISREICCPPGLILSLFWVGVRMFLKLKAEKIVYRHAHNTKYAMHINLHIFTCISMQHHAHTDAHAHTHTDISSSHLFRPCLVFGPSPGKWRTGKPRKTRRIQIQILRKTFVHIVHAPYAYTYTCTYLPNQNRCTST